MKIHGPNAEIASRTEWADGLATFRVRPVGWDLPDFKPGQFGNLALPEGEDWDRESGAAIRRAYSIASAPGEDALDFYVRLVEDGALTPKLFALGPGDSIHMDERMAGAFTLDKADGAEDLVLVATGTGVGPFRPMLLDRDARSHFGRVVLVYGARYASDLGYLEEFRQLAREDDSICFVPAVSRGREGEDWDGPTGRVTEHMTPEAYERHTGKPLEPERCQVFLCGNPAMIADVRAGLESHGFKIHRRREPGQIHTEKYW